jgi:hypothetical protein
MATMTALATTTVGAGGASTILFSNIPQTYTDLQIVVSARSSLSNTGDYLLLNFNGSASNVSSRTLGAFGTSSEFSGTEATLLINIIPAATSTANTFGNNTIYIPNYQNPNFKAVSVEGGFENSSATNWFLFMTAGLLSSTSPITSVTLDLLDGNFLQNSTATLYGVWSGPETLPSTPTIGTATATGPTTATVAFTPTSATNVDASYTALSSPGSITVTGTSSPVTVTGLTTGTPYTFQVRANNPGGSSAYSAASNSVTPPNSYESIATVTVGAGGSATVSFTSIPATYTHLQIRSFSRIPTGGNNGLLTFNSDTGANYATHLLYGDGASAAAISFINDNYIYGSRVSTATSTYGVGVIDILDYANTNKFKTVRLLTGNDDNGSGIVSLNSGLWRSTSAITSITYTAQSGGTFAQYTQFALYGIKGA